MIFKTLIWAYWNNNFYFEHNILISCYKLLTNQRDLKCMRIQGWCAQLVNHKTM